MAISVAQARQICTKAELDLVLLSTTRQIGNLDARQLRAKIRRTRTLRDKWRDLAAEQTRQTKTNAPGDLGRANARSAEKAQLFDEALGRFEKRLAKLAPEGGATAAPAAAAKNPPRAVRSTEHRARRAAVRDILDAHTEKLNSDKVPAKKKKPKSAKALEAAGNQAAAGASDGAASKPARGRATATRKTGAPKKKAGPPKRPTRMAKKTSFQDSLVTKSQTKRNLRAKTAAKQANVRASGATKIHGHISGQNKRNQAGRNKR